MLRWILMIFGILEIVGGLGKAEAQLDQESLKKFLRPMEFDLKVEQEPPLGVFPYSLNSQEIESEIAGENLGMVIVGSGRYLARVDSQGKLFLVRTFSDGSRVKIAPHGLYLLIPSDRPTQSPESID